MSAVRKIADPATIPIYGGKIIHEYVGLASSSTASVSVAHMVAPAGWGEPWQQPLFDEVTIVVRGRLLLEHDGGALTIGKDEVALAPAGAQIRYSNPFEEEAEYWAVCGPAFSAEAAGRQDQSSETPLRSKVSPSSAAITRVTSAIAS